MKIIWDQAGARLYETGVKQGVLYPQAVNGTYPVGVPWNGLISITESPGGAEASPLYADDIKYINLMSAETFEASLEAYMYPDEFMLCDGGAALSSGVIIGQQARQPFGLCYRTTLGNDTVGDAYGYKLHLIYGATASPSERAYQTINDSPEANTFSWEVSTIPQAVTGKRPSANVVIDSTKVDADKLAALELILYGNTGVDPRLPSIDEVAEIFAGAAPSAVALSSIVPAANATGIAVGANIVLTFNNKIAEEAIVVTTAAGVIVPAAKTWDAAGKILTIDPTSNMSAATVHLVAISGVADIYNQTLAASVSKFTTA